MATATHRRLNDRANRALKRAQFARVLGTGPNAGREGLIVAVRGWRVLLAFKDGGRSPLPFAVGAVEAL